MRLVATGARPGGAAGSRAAAGGGGGGGGAVGAYRGFSVQPRREALAAPKAAMTGCWSNVLRGVRALSKRPAVVLFGASAVSAGVWLAQVRRGGWSSGVRPPPRHVVGMTRGCSCSPSTLPLCGSPRSPSPPPPGQSEWRRQTRLVASSAAGGAAEQATNMYSANSLGPGPSPSEGLPR